MNINVEIAGYYVVFSMALAVFAYILLRDKRKMPLFDALLVLVLMVVPPFSLLALWLLNARPNKIKPG